MFPSPSLAGWGGGKWREIWGNSGATTCKHQQRFPHIPPAAACTGPAIPASLPPCRVFIPLESIFSSNQWPSKQHLENLCCWGFFFVVCFGFFFFCLFVCFNLFFFPFSLFLGEGNSWACWPHILPSTSRLHCTWPGWRCKAAPLLSVPLDIFPVL